MKEVKLSVDPPTVFSGNFEDLLATDDLFIDYFNDFLSLPSFPEPLCFNKESGGFEILNSSKKKLADEIKAAVRSGRRRKKIYRHVKNHAFSDIPLIPMEQPLAEEEKEIDTSFVVKTLNKEQGIEWIKKERLPAFLESDCYIEYRLAKLVSQAQPVAQPGEIISFRLDKGAHLKKPKKSVEEKLAEEIDQTKSLMQNLYVCMGETSTTDTEAWVSQAKMALSDTTTTASSTAAGYPPGISPRPASALCPSVSSRPTTSCMRPTSAMSMVESAYRSDSGIWSPAKGSIYGSTLDMTTHYTGSVLTNEDAEEREEEVINSKLFGDTIRAITPRPSNTVVMLAPPQLDSISQGPVYSVPQPPTPIIETSSDSDNESSSSSLYLPSRPTSAAPPPSEAESMESYSAMLVGNVLRDALMTLTGMSAEQAASNIIIETLLGGQTVADSSTSPRDGLSTIDEGVPSSPAKSQPGTPVENPSQRSPSFNKEDTGQESDDSLLNSDEDYDEHRDQFFRKRKRHKIALIRRKGIEAFKQFLMGTLGEKNWNFWMDVERSTLIQREDELQNYLMAVRERYHKHGAPFELSQETKVELELTKPSQWTLDRLIDVQTRMVEPLIRYWAPRFLLKQNVEVTLERNFQYLQQRELLRPTEVYPNPTTISLLPLRPKSCMPRIQKSTATEAQPVQISGMFDPPSEVAPTKSQSEPTISARQFCLSPSCSPCSPTTPRVGMRRRYDLPKTSVSSGKTEKDKQNKERQNEEKSPKQLISLVLKASGRPHTAPSRKVSRVKSPSDKWETSSVSSLSEMKKTSSRVPSAGSKRVSVSAKSEVSQFYGGRRLEGLLQALACERRAGGVLRKYLKQTGNERWCHGLRFWLELQEYHQMFYSEVLDIFLLEKKAKQLYSKYIVSGAPVTIECGRPVKQQIYKQLLPPFEELFDAAEEYILEILYEAWSQMLVCDISTFDKVELIDEKRHLSTKSKYFQCLQRRGIIKDRPESPEDPMAGYSDPVYDDNLLSQIPEEFRDYSLEKLVHNRLELEHFRVFLAENYASMDLLCWMDIEAFRRIPHKEERRRDLKAKDIRRKYLNKKYFFGPNSPAGKEGQDKVMESCGGWGKLLEERPPSTCLLEAQKYVRQRLEKKWLPLFLAAPDFAERQRPQSSMDDVVEDVMIQRKKKSQAIWKMLESKWVSSSKDVIVFRKALLNPISSLQFRRYVSIKGDNFENDVLFWQEIQRYKDLCHQHSDRSLVLQKVGAIVNCFLDSPIPPTLQVDIPQEMADHIIERKSELTPYLFREAQLTVFRMLFSQWTDFCTFRSNLTEDKVLPTIERHRRRAKADERRKRKEADRKKEKEIAKKRALGIPIDPDEESTEAANDPFERMANVSDDDEDAHGKEAMSWSYSQYIQAFDEEDVLNEVDVSTFSSLMSMEARSELKDDASVVSGESRRKSKASESLRVKVETGSQTDLRPKSALRKPRLTTGSDRSDSSSHSHLDTRGKVVRSTNTRRGSNDSGHRVRLDRRMPPLTAKR